ncbi:MAG: hypothetical protein ACFCD0_16115 [Gemmataceae bacterium]
MKSKLWVSGILVLLSTGTVVAQSPLAPTFRPGMAPARGPAVSPYLNLLRAGGSPSFNYATLVRPQLQFRQSVLGLQNQINTVQQNFTTQRATSQPQDSELAPTGVRAGFQTHQGGSQGFGFQSQSRYFRTVVTGSSSFQPRGLRGR